MNYEPLDSLPYIDDDITDIQRFEIQKLIETELQTENTTQIHPKVKDLFPFPDKPHTVLKNIPAEDIVKYGFSLGGIDLSRYSELGNSDNLKKSIIYQLLKLNSLRLLNEYGANQWLITNDLSALENELIKEEASNKKQKINEMNEYRQHNQLEIKATIDFLTKRWEEGISKNVDIGVEIASIL